MFFEVIPTEVYRHGGGALTYTSDLNLRPGHLVLIPLGKKTVPGIVQKKVPAVDFPTKSILRLLHPKPLPTHLLKSAHWLADYYLSPLPLTMNLLFPKNLVLKRQKNPILPDSNTKSPLAPSKAAKIAPQSSDFPIIPLNTPQKNALKSLQKAPCGTSLLRGVTGSGKTNIYLRMALDALKQQKSTILLVPEIALTSQLAQIFAQTFPGRIFLIHSGQTLAERRTTWLKIHETTSSNPIIVIGPRSALLSPVHNLGLIIIDEAHESAYYQENSPRYSAVRLAGFEAKCLNIPCILGSATPNIVDYHLARTKNSLIELAQKAKTTAIDPHFSLIDLKNRANFSKNRYFSNALLAEIEQNLAQDRQTLIFHNRRGSAPLTICEHCGWQALCPNCYLPLTLHTDSYSLCCHLCGHETKVPSSCPCCGQVGIIHKGFGTKLLESELQKIFPEAKIARFDGDNTKSESLSHLYNNVKSGEIDLLIGTQTLARGLDLPHLATVGIVQADAGLSLPDFAAEERTFELLTQVIGRVGRGHIDTAKVIIQTYQPDSPIIRIATEANFPKFADYLLRQRRLAHLPPFTHLAKLQITFKTEKTTLAKIRKIHQDLSNCPDITLSPPSPAFHERGARGFSWQIIIKSRSHSTLCAALRPYLGLSGYSIILDPPSLL